MIINQRLYIVYQSRCHPAKSSSSESSSAFLIVVASFDLLYSLMNLPASFLSSATNFASLHYLGIIQILIDLFFEAEISQSLSGKKSSLVISVSKALSKSMLFLKYKSICPRLRSKRLLIRLQLLS